jgi:hypothetical protein
MLKHSRLISINPQSDLDADPRALAAPDLESPDVEEAEREAIDHQTQSLQSLLETAPEDFMSDEGFESALRAWLDRTSDPEELAAVRKVIDDAIVRRTQEAASAFQAGKKLQRELRITTRSDAGKPNPKRGRKS